MTDDQPAVGPDPTPFIHHAARWTGLLLFAGVSWLYAFTGLLAPTWGVAILWGLWLAQLWIFIKLWRNQGWRVLVASVVAYLIWAGVLLAGDVFLGWTA